MIATLVLGAGGLIGRAVIDAAPGEARTAVVRWDRSERDDDLAAAVTALASDVRTRGVGWRIIWCAGRSVISDARSAHLETDALRVTLDAVRARLPGGRTGRFVLTSSAGGIHADDRGRIIDESSTPTPKSDYGREKLAQERLLAEVATSTGFDAVAVRLGPVYGPGQDPSKSQGLVSALCRAVVDRRPVRIFVPLETRRPYIWSGDAGRTLVRIANAPVGTGGAVRIRTIPAGPGIQVGELIETIHRVTRRRPPVLIAPGREAAAHARDLPLATRFPEETVLPDRTSMTVGVGRLWHGLLADPTPSSWVAVSSRST